MPSRNNRNTLTLNSVCADVYLSQFKTNLRITGEIGIEVELENIRRIPVPLAESDWWTHKEDTSLRNNGREFVLAKPCTMKELPGVLGDFNSWILGTEASTSIRTSTHIHHSVLRCTLREIYAAIVAHYLFEELLITHVPQERRGNLFCLRMKDSQSIGYLLSRSIKRGTFFSQFREESAKYSALNICTVTRFGSLEWRFLPAFMDGADIEKWCIAFHDMVSAATNLEPIQVLQLYESLPVRDFCAKFFRNSPWVYSKLTPGFLNELIHTNYDNLVEFLRVFNSTDAFFQLPQNLWDEDNDSSDGEIRPMYEFDPSSLNLDELSGVVPTDDIVILDDDLNQ